ncbi:PREDICTED: fibropellin-1-like, partial [Branchiostoma belcheri]|uniref:Fibropellin-1-like n=1 Tax=Branchiostoma belcheri TaxID=7741 RepID=A0A6P4ZFQ2_BRABE
LDIGECLSDPCQNGATCVDRTNYYICVCAPGWEGTHCEININECASGPCKNNATCHDWVNYYTCSCTSGWEGTHCEINTDECASSPCLNSATCHDRVNYYTCECADGYSGTHCETDINECASSPCRNGSTCLDIVNGYICQCDPGWKGVHCDIDIDECVSEPCLNQGRCFDIVNGYGCICRYGWIGTHCDINRLCPTNPCENDGDCWLVPAGFRCLCYNGWTGTYCEKVFLGENVEADWQLGDSITRGDWSAGERPSLLGDCRQRDRFPFRVYNPQCPGNRNDVGQAVSNVEQHSGNFSWHFKRGYDTQKGGTPFSPGLNTTAGRTDGNYTAGADSFYASFFFKLANTKLDESKIAVVAGNPQGNERASNYLEIYAEPEQRGARFKGLHIRVADSYPSYEYCALHKNCPTGHYFYIAERLNISVWHRIEMTLHAKPVDYFDEWHYVVDQKYNLSGGAYMQTQRYDEGLAYEYVNRLKFQPRHDNYKKKYHGFFFDDVYYRAFNAEEKYHTIEEYGTSFEEFDLP